MNPANSQPWLTKRSAYLRLRRWTYLQLAYLLWMFRHRGETFVFEGKPYEYFWHPYNGTWQNERCVELAVTAAEYARARSAGKRILEVGHVLSHYGFSGHAVVDKYERSIGVINQDVLDFRPPDGQRYDFIVSISTLEHVGLDENPAQSQKFWSAIDNLRRYCLASGGKMVVTLPLGYNSEIDSALAFGKPIFARQFFLQQIAARSKWEQRGWAELEVNYDHAFGKANAVLIGSHTDSASEAAG